MAADLMIDAFNLAGAAYRTTGASFLEHFAVLMVDRANLRTGGTVVDLATGPGTVALAAAAAVGSKGSVIGLDLAERQLELARQAFADLRRRARFVHMDACVLDLPERRAAAVLCGFGIPYFDEPLRAVREAARVAERGASVVFTAWGEPWFGAPGVRLLQVMERREVPQLYRPLTTNPQELAQWCIRAGLRDVVVEEHDHDVSFPSFDAWWAMNRAFAFLARLDRVDAETRAAVEEHLAADPAVVGTDGAVELRMRVYLVRAIAP